MRTGEDLRRRDELLEWVLAVHRHDLFAHLVGRPVEADGETETEILLGQLENLRDDPGSRDGNATSTKAEAPGGVHRLEGSQQVIVVGERLAHAHDHDIVKRGQPLGRPGRVGLVLDAADLDQLGDDFAHGQVALPALEPGGAKLAAIGAAHLGRDTDRPAGLILPHAFHRGPDDDGLNEGPITEALQELLGDV